MLFKKNRRMNAASFDEKMSDSDRIRLEGQTKDELCDSMKRENRRYRNTQESLENTVRMLEDLVITLGEKYVRKLNDVGKAKYYLLTGDKEKVELYARKAYKKSMKEHKYLSAAYIAIEFSLGNHFGWDNEYGDDYFYAALKRGYIHYIKQKEHVLAAEMARTIYNNQDNWQVWHKGKERSEIALKWMQAAGKKAIEQKLMQKDYDELYALAEKYSILKEARAAIAKPYLDRWCVDAKQRQDQEKIEEAMRIGYFDPN